MARRFATPWRRQVTVDRGKALVNKKTIWIGMFVGSSIGGFVPMLWHASLLSMSAIVLSTLGGIAGIWAAYRLGR